MGCSNSRDVRGNFEMPVVRASSLAAERREILSPLPKSHAASTLGSLGIYRGGHHSMLAYSPLLHEAPAWSEESPHHVSRAPMRSLPAVGKRGLVEVLDDTASVISMTAHWPTLVMSSIEQWATSQKGIAGESSTPLQVRYVSDFDPAVMPGFQGKDAGSLVEMMEEPFDDMVTPIPASWDMPEVTGLVRARINEFEEKLEAKKKLKEQAYRARGSITGEEMPPPCHRMVVVYFTSIRGVRRTFEDSRAVCDILRSYPVRVDERDVSMHAAFKDELRDLLGMEGLALPRVFTFSDHDVVDLGGVDDVRGLHEAGKLASVLNGCEPLADGAQTAPPCAGCGDMRFLPCETCHGSGKLFACGDAGGSLDGMFLQCLNCNENGLIRCPVCCY